jgi:predicted CxxxxCH...CXXCH cytochrome family protein
VDIQGRSVTTNVSVGKHDKHVAPAMMSPIACTECHAARTASVITDTAHIDGNGIAEVVLGTLSRTGGAAAAYNRTSATSATCSSNYCHGSFTGGTTTTPNWATGTAMTCTSCHGNPPSTGRHSTHQSRNIACTACHGTGFTRTGTTTGTVNVTLHVNGAKNVPLTAGGSRIQTWNASTRSCTPSSGSGCHGSQTWR